MIYKQQYSLLIVSLFTLALSKMQSQATDTNSNAERNINQMLTDWHTAAATAEFTDYFSYFTPDAIFIGTDPEEVWNKKEFMEYAKPHFDRKKAWNFTNVERHIYLKKNSNIAWFDELLRTQMGLCRGSGVVIFKNNHWLIQHYVLSIAIPNENVSEITRMKAVHDSLYQLEKL